MAFEPTASQEQTKLPRHIVWSTETLNLADPFQRKWYLRQVLMHGRAQDIRSGGPSPVVKQVRRTFKVRRTWMLERLDLCELCVLGGEKEVAMQGRKTTFAQEDPK